jgi:hypothetical protein
LFFKVKLKKVDSLYNFNLFRRGGTRCWRIIGEWYVIISREIFNPNTSTPTIRATSSSPEGSLPRPSMTTSCSNATSPDPSTNGSAQSYQKNEDDDIQEVVAPIDNSHSVSQYEVVQQQQAAPAPMEQNTVALMHRWKQRFGL